MLSSCAAMADRFGREPRRATAKEDGVGGKRGTTAAHHGEVLDVVVLAGVDYRRRLATANGGRPRGRRRAWRRLVGYLHDSFDVDDPRNMVDLLAGSARLGGDHGRGATERQHRWCLLAGKQVGEGREREAAGEEEGLGS